MLQLIYDIYKNLKDNVILKLINLLYNSFIINEFKLCRSAMTYINVFDVLFTHI